MSDYLKIRYGAPCPTEVCYKHFAEYNKHVRTLKCKLCTSVVQENTKFWCEVTGFSKNVAWVCENCSNTKYLSTNYTDCLKEIQYRKSEKNDSVHVICNAIMLLLQRVGATILTSLVKQTIGVPKKSTIIDICDIITKWIPNYVNIYWGNKRYPLLFRKIW